MILSIHSIQPGWVDYIIMTGSMMMQYVNVISHSKLKRIMLLVIMFLGKHYLPKENMMKQ